MEFLREIYTVSDLHALRSRLIATLPKLVPADMTTYHEMNPAQATSENWVEPPELGTAFWAQIWAQYMTEHPVLTYNLRTQDGRAFKISDFLAQSQFHRLGLYNEFFHRMGVEDVMSFALSMSPSHVIGMGLHRSKRNFSERDRLRLNLLRPHLSQTYRNAAVVTRMQQELTLVKQGVEKLDQGIIVLTQNGRVQLMTARAQQWVEAYFGVPAGLTDTLPAALERWFKHQEALLLGTDTVPPTREPLVAEREGKRLVVRLLAEGEHYLLLLEEQRTTLSPEALKSLGLTRREAEVLAWVAQGRSNYAIGVLLGIREPTVKKHLEHIYAKLGVWNRTEAGARALAVVNGQDLLHK
jgi:DNA-binding CsgD family transcriptional regulator